MDIRGAVKNIIADYTLTGIDDIDFNDTFDGNELMDDMLEIITDVEDAIGVDLIEDISYDDGYVMTINDFIKAVEAAYNNY